MANENPSLEELANIVERQSARDCAEAAARCQSLLVDAVMKHLTGQGLSPGAHSKIAAAMRDAFVIGFVAGRE